MSRRMELLLGVIAIVGVVLVAGLVFDTVKIFSDESKTCKIQAQGLPAGHELAASMKDIHILLTQPPTPAAKRQQAEVPPKQLAYELAVLLDLNTHLDKYSKAEAKQPQTRAC